MQSKTILRFIEKQQELLSEPRIYHYLNATPTSVQIGLSKLKEKGKIQVLTLEDLMRLEK